MQTRAHATSTTATGRRAVGFTAALLAAGALAGTTASDAASTATAPAPAIECGGYDADGELLRPLAAQTTHAAVADDGRVVVPATCGGYTEDGAFVGDD